MSHLSPDQCDKLLEMLAREEQDAFDALELAEQKGNDAERALRQIAEIQVLMMSVPRVA